MTDGDAAVPMSEWRGRGTLLLADDDEHYREVMRTFLAKRGFRVIDVPDGVAAIQAFHAFGRDIVAVLMDTLMPRVDGPGAAKAIRAMVPDVPILSVSARDDVSTVYPPGVIREHLQMPFKVENLLRALRRAIEAPSPKT